LNALKYGQQDAPVNVSVGGDEHKVRFAVQNKGPAIEPSALNWIFDPLKRGISEEYAQRTDSLGLGLYIARQIAISHGGDIEASSAAAQTVFSVVLPRQGS